MHVVHYPIPGAVCEKHARRRMAKNEHSRELFAWFDGYLRQLERFAALAQCHAFFVPGVRKVRESYCKDSYIPHASHDGMLFGSLFGVFPGFDEKEMCCQTVTKKPLFDTMRHNHRLEVDIVGRLLCSSRSTFCNTGLPVNVLSHHQMPQPHCKKQHGVIQSACHTYLYLSSLSAGHGLSGGPAIFWETKVSYPPVTANLFSFPAKVVKVFWFF
jgi:hypothetical protein